MTGLELPPPSRGQRDVTSPLRVGDEVLRVPRGDIRAGRAPDRDGGVGERTLFCIGRAEPSGDCLREDSIETSTDNLIIT